MAASASGGQTSLVKACWPEHRDRASLMEFLAPARCARSLDPTGKKHRRPWAIPDSENRTEVNKRYTMVPLQRVGDPIEAARTSLFLASDDSSYLCGAEIAVDGGMLTGQYYVGFPGAPGV